MIAKALVAVSVLLAVGVGCSAADDGSEPAAAQVDQKIDSKIEPQQRAVDISVGFEGDPKDCDECSNRRRTCCSGGRCWDESC